METMETTDPVQALAGECRKHFEIGHREATGERYLFLDDGSSKELQELVRVAHGEMLPDDRRYDYIYEALCAIESDGENAEMEADIYTHDLTGWLHSRVDRYAYCDEFAAEYGFQFKRDTDQNMIALLQGGQWLEKREVLESVRFSLEKIAAEFEEEDVSE